MVLTGVGAVLVSNGPKKADLADRRQGVKSSACLTLLARQDHSLFVLFFFKYIRHSSVKDASHKDDKPF